MGNLIEFHEKEYGIIRLNRPEKHHAITQEMAAKLLLLLKAAKTKPISFLVIESSGGKSFCAGGDLYEFHGQLNEREALKRLSAMKDVLKEIILFPVPVICLLQGNAYGGGCELATACDIRIAKEGMKSGFVQTNLGILPGWGGGAILYQKIASAKAFHWITNGEIYETNVLQEIGWVQEVIDETEWDNKEVILKNYLAKSKEQMHLLKKQYMSILDTKKLLEKMDKEVAACASIWESELHQQHVQSFMNR